MSAFRQFTTLPNLPSPGPLERYIDTLGLIVPFARTNEVINPSVETNLTGWNNGAGSIARTTAQQYHGAYSVIYTPSAAVNDGPFYSPIATTTGQTRAISVKVLGAPGVPYKLSVANTTPADLVAVPFIGTGSWQWIWLFFTETSSANRRIYITKNNSASVASFYIDGLQSEVCGSEGVFVTTYIDGDQLGFVTPQSPAAYLWSGTPHGSTSSRSGQTRAGGRIVRFKDFGFFLSAVIGLGLATPRNEALAYGQLDGAQYNNTVKPTRSVSFVGRWGDYTPTAMDSGEARLARQIDRDRIATRQPLALCLQARYCNQDIGEFVTIPRAIYASGLEGTTQELPTEAGNITFSQYFPYVVGRDGGVSLTVQQTITNTNLIAQRPPTGQWAALGTGMDANGVFALLQSPAGILYAGGAFLDAGGSGADDIASWDGTTWSTLGGATALNGQVQLHGLAMGPSGILYVVGFFTNAGANASADFIATWNGAAWGNLSTGSSGNMYAVTVGNDGQVYAGGLAANTLGGVAVAGIGRWSGAAWNAMGTGIPSGIVQKLLTGPDGAIYAGGSFPSIGGVGSTAGLGKWNGSAWVSIGTVAGASATIYDMAFGPDGTLYVVGDFTSVGGVAASYVASYNGTVWTPLGTGADARIRGIAVSPAGNVYVSGLFTTIGGITPPDHAAMWNGSAWVFLDIDTPWNEIFDIKIKPDGTLVLAGDTAGSSTAAGITTVTNNGTAETPPTIIIRGPSSGSSRIYQLVNTTTGAAIYFNYTIQSGETATLILDPKNLSFTSTFRGNIYNTILPGSQSAQFVLQPGSNTISFFAAASTVTAVMTWQTRYLMLEDALYSAVEP